MERLPRSQRNPYLLISGVSGYILLAAFVNIFPPDALWRIALFIIAFTASTGLLIQYVLRRIQQSILLGFGLALFLVLRFFGLRSPVYPALLIACIVAIEILWKRK